VGLLGRMLLMALLWQAALAPGWAATTGCVGGSCHGVTEFTTRPAAPPAVPDVCLHDADCGGAHGSAPEFPPAVAPAPDAAIAAGPSWLTDPPPAEAGGRSIVARILRPPRSA
jgi:hypothetical protein